MKDLIFKYLDRNCVIKNGITFSYPCVKYKNIKSLFNLSEEEFKEYINEWLTKYPDIDIDIDFFGPFIKLMKIKLSSGYAITNMNSVLYGLSISSTDTQKISGKYFINKFCHYIKNT